MCKMQIPTMLNVSVRVEAEKILALITTVNESKHARTRSRPGLLSFYRCNLTTSNMILICDFLVDQVIKLMCLK